MKIVESCQDHCEMLVQNSKWQVHAVPCLSKLQEEKMGVSVDTNMNERRIVKPTSCHASTKVHEMLREKRACELAHNKREQKVFEIELWAELRPS